MRQILGHNGNDTLAGGSGNDFIEGKGGATGLFGRAVARDDSRATAPHRATTC